MGQQVTSPNTQRYPDEIQEIEDAIESAMADFDNSGDINSFRLGDFDEKHEGEISRR